MLREVLRNRLFLVGLLFFVLIVVGGVFYLKPIEHETAEDLAGTQERMKPLTETQKPTTEAPVGDTSQDRHSHADGTFHAGPGESEVQEILPTESESELIHPASPEAAVITQGDPTSDLTQDPSELSVDTQEEGDSYKAWSNKAKEIRRKISQAAKEHLALTPATEEDLKRYKTDKEWQRKLSEAIEKIGEIERMRQEHEANRPSFQ